jgi:hypothetical protein
MTSATYWLRTPQARQNAREAILVAPETYVCRIEDEPRTPEQNDHAHAALTDISRQLQWHGKKLNVLTWKRLTMAAFLREIGHQPELIPALDGNGFDVIFEHSSKLGKKKFSAWLVWIYAFGTQNKVVFRDRHHAS